MKAPVLLTIAALAAASLACSLNIDLPSVTTLKPGPIQTLMVSEPRPEGDNVIDVEIKMGAGSLNIAPGAEGLIEGEIQYNVSEWKPEVSFKAGRLVIEQGNPKNRIAIPENSDEIVNQWDLKLGDVPMNLDIAAGAYDGELDLSGLPLRKLSVHDGASNAKLVFDLANPEEMGRLLYETGASTVSLSGLANANAAAIDFIGGAGSYVLDFSGELQRDVDVTVKAGVSSVRLVVPAGTAAEITVNGGLNDVSTIGEWDKSGDRYTLQGEGPRLTIVVEMGVGSLTLVTR